MGAWHRHFDGAVSDLVTFPGGGAIRHGGSDIELSAKYSVKQTDKTAVSGEIGVGFPNTPAERSSHLTAGITGSMNMGSGIDLYINPRVAFITDNSLIGFGMGAKAKLARQISLIADYTPILSGANTIDATTRKSAQPRYLWRGAPVL